MSDCDRSDVLDLLLLLVQATAVVGAFFVYYRDGPNAKLRRDQYYQCLRVANACLLFCKELDLEKIRELYICCPLDRYHRHKPDDIINVMRHKLGSAGLRLTMEELLEALKTASYLQLPFQSESCYQFMHFLNMAAHGEDRIAFKDLVEMVSNLSAVLGVCREKLEHQSMMARCQPSREVFIISKKVQINLETLLDIYTELEVLLLSYTCRSECNRICIDIRNLNIDCPDNWRGHWNDKTRKIIEEFCREYVDGKLEEYVFRCLQQKKECHGRRHDARLQDLQAYLLYFQSKLTRLKDFYIHVKHFLSDMRGVSEKELLDGTPAFHAVLEPLEGLINELKVVIDKGCSGLAPHREAEKAQPNGGVDVEEGISYISPNFR